MEIMSAILKVPMTSQFKGDLCDLREELSLGSLFLLVPRSDARARR